MLSRTGKSKVKSAYSLVEVIVSLAIVGVILTVLFNTLIVSLRISYNSFARSFTREEVSQIATLVTRDIRNAESVIACGEIESVESCDLVVDGTQIRWTECGEQQVCRQVYDEETQNYSDNYTSSNSVRIDVFSFAAIFDTSTSAARKIIFVTINASHKNENLNINNIVRQQSITTRNYEI